MSFLNAAWRKLVMINYEVNPGILQKYVPNGTELDFFNDKCYVSVIGFMFLDTKILGMKIPFHRNFEEVNLRFYVKRKVKNEYKRGVVFIKEIVPKSAITFVANTIYNENYETLPMKHIWEESDEKLKVSYQWKKAKKWNEISVEVSNTLCEVEENSEAEFIAEHYWGYAKNINITTEYEVKHPKWKQYLVEDYKVAIDFLATYGKCFKELENQKPTSVFLMEGSEISVENKIVF
ncbi:hypothetical protein CXF68_00170 [Tenacibaculum sp. Bg11-29]|uniref:YqjF family protein n=1 Tax=Tenacibaculum sp. Bg11-29 TaxID=2058306 RepID=UPI000C32F7A4|nr:DUF2071 domain-containing protein [Tenacibaculum sp. Bg11-29]PKH49195.1 hypothetical protein CXF68_00170 [Tenacibaculum sp. Bg11-29]